ncbi:hypothetical protein ACFQ8T_18365 [Isoptericola sp. NPDC056618]|uniref:hypothetical protein n=1 Tax=Isoptericola sp. NPDC056618 TaxID=3345878 RepID=UPI00369378CB
MNAGTDPAGGITRHLRGLVAAVVAAGALTSLALGLAGVGNSLLQVSTAVGVVAILALGARDERRSAMRDARARALMRDNTSAIRHLTETTRAADARIAEAIDDMRREQADAHARQADAAAQVAADVDRVVGLVGRLDAVHELERLREAQARNGARARLLAESLRSHERTRG